jgi:23S rRNA (cytosine1962-C5)-methyltransferase
MRRLEFLVPNEHHRKTLRELVGRAWPHATDAQLNRAFKDKKVRVDERVSMNPDRAPEPGATITVDAEPGEEPVGIPEAHELARGAGWVVVEKPTGMQGELDRDDPMNPVLFLADTLGLDRATFTPVWTHPDQAGGPWLCAESPERADELFDAWASGELMITWSALVPSPGQAQGRIQSVGGVPIDYSTTTIRSGVSELQLTANPAEADLDDEELADLNPAEMLLAALAGAQIPALGDAERGGFMVGGGVRLRVTAFFQADGDLGHSWNPGKGWWPSDPVVLLPAEADDEEREDLPDTREIGELLVSVKTMEVITRQKHPWVLADGKTGKRDHMKPGDLVQLKGVDDSAGPYALIEGTGELAARVWSHDRESAERFHEEVDIRVDEAVSNRTDLLRTMAETDLFRLIHGQADGLPGFHLDRVGPLLRATLTGATSYAFKERVYDNMLDFDPDAVILEVEHLRDIRRETTPKAKLVRGNMPYLRQGQRLVGMEAGLKYWVEPWEGVDTGFFADQRDNRALVREFAPPGSEWLNLFCHTGAFTVALVAEGAEVVSVDISQRYLDWLEENLELNELQPDKNESVAEDAREYVKGCDREFHGIIVDPPTAASSDAGFWSVRSEYTDLLAGCFELLHPRGLALVCRNDKNPSGDLEDLVDDAAEAAGREVLAIEEAPPAHDYPSLRGFPEGDSFEGLLVRVD